MADFSYKVPSKSITVEQVIKNSKFITSVSRVTDKQKAKEFIDSVSRKNSGASHNCYAFVAGNPFSTTDIGFGDDGEVSGTAGKPMLSVLQHKKIGEIAVVVSRYFGGTKLGTGGLVRAYSSSVQDALDSLPLEDCVDLETIKLTFDYQYENAVRQVLSKFSIEISDSNYKDNVEMRIEVKESVFKELQEDLNNSLSGDIEIII
ncbi:MAG: YigZ family protein [Candidatus Dadabacteria bacterium]|nr:YigZ family protein [Candidatus Dadabacteria bacterium]NIS09049.1 YigZ family protein [Candidatus Dadabacteria bacterium]NIX15643.1 YigZ family protein [Candidatus Dadabacteria bacterium]NIY22385.1 YigZ family protein [Candidatus Dadabacteria bacterium]